jgi:hypothetical protein
MEFVFFQINVYAIQVLFIFLIHLKNFNKIKNNFKKLKGYVGLEIIASSKNFLF